MIVTRYGQRFEMDSSEVGVNNIMETMHQRLPWIEVGYSNDLRNMFHKARNQLVSRVDERRHHIQQQLRG